MTANIPSVVVQEHAKKFISVLIGEHPALQSLHDLCIQELAKETPDMATISAGIIESSKRALTATNAMITDLLSKAEIDELQPQLDYVFTGCMTDQSEEMISALDSELASMIRSQNEFAVGLDQALAEKFGPSAVSEAMKKAGIFEEFVGELTKLQGFNQMVEESANSLAEEMAPIVAQGMAGEII